MDSTRARRRLAFAVFPLVALGGACAGRATPPPLEPRFDSIQKNIFDVSCAVPQCHIRPGPQHELVLAPGNAWAQLVDVPSAQKPALRLVVPGDPDASYLLRKLEGRGIIGERMPSAQPRLPDDQIAAIREWIRRGAPND